VAEQKFSAAEREAIWLAYNKKCAYTSESLDVSSFHIDHIVPESLANDPIELAKVKAAYQVGEDFDVNDCGNVLPSNPGTDPERT
jgi:hypothetical protein